MDVEREVDEDDEGFILEETTVTDTAPLITMFDRDEAAKVSMECTSTDIAVIDDFHFEATLAAGVTELPVPCGSLSNSAVELTKDVDSAEVIAIRDCDDRGAMAVIATNVTEDAPVVMALDRTTDDTAKSSWLMIKAEEALLAINVMVILAAPFCPDADFSTIAVDDANLVASLVVPARREPADTDEAIAFMDTTVIDDAPVATVFDRDDVAVDSMEWPSAVMAD